MSIATPSRLHGLDTLRALAIVLVVIFHLQSFLPDALQPGASIGWMGVDLFFVLSGYLIGSQLLRPYALGQTVSFTAFYSRRAYRILPAYIVVVLLCFFVPAWREWPGLPPAWKFLTFTANLFVDFAQGHAFSQVWSLCVEEHFYLVLPALVYWQMKKPAAWKTIGLILGVLVFGMGLRAWELLHVVRAPGLNADQTGTLFMQRIYYPTYTRLDGLLVGVALAVLRTFRSSWWNKVARSGNLLLLCGLLVVSGAIWMFHGGYPSSEQTAGILFGFPILSLGLGLLVASALCDTGPLRRRVLGAETLATLAYSLYLTHKEVAHMDRLAFPWLQQNRSWIAAGIYAASCLLCAALLYVCVERPFLLLRARRSDPSGNRAAQIEAVSVEVHTDPAI